MQRKEQHPHLHLGVVAIEKGAFRLPSATVSQLILLSTDRLFCCITIVNSKVYKIKVSMKKNFKLQYNIYNRYNIYIVYMD